MAVRSSFRPAGYQLNLTSVDLQTAGDLYALAPNVASAGLTELIANVFVAGGDGLVLEVRESVDGGANWDFVSEYAVAAGKATAVLHRVTCDTLRLRLQPQTAEGVATAVRAGVVCHTDPPKTHAVQLEGADAAAGDLRAVRVSAGGSVRSAPAPPVYPAGYQLAMAERASNTDLFAGADTLDVSNYQYMSITITQNATENEAPPVVAGIFSANEEPLTSTNLGQLEQQYLMGPVNDVNATFSERVRVVYHRISTKFVRVNLQQDLYISPTPPYTEDAEGTEYPISVQVALHEDISVLPFQQIGTLRGPLGSSPAGDLHTVMRGKNPADASAGRDYTEAHVVDNALKVLPVGGLEMVSETSAYRYSVSGGSTFQIGTTLSPAGNEGESRLLVDTVSVSNLASSGTAYVHLMDAASATNFELRGASARMFTIPVEAGTTKTAQYRVPVVNSLALLASDKLVVDDATANPAAAGQVTAVVTYRDTSP